MRSRFLSRLRSLIGPAVIAVLLAPLVMAVLDDAPSTTVAEPVDGVLLASRSGTFRITGRVVGLHPGMHKMLLLRLKNLNPTPIRVVSVRVRVRSTAAACPSNVVHVGRLKRRANVTVKARRVRKVSLPVSMLISAPDACQGARFRLRYQGKALKQ